MTDHEVAHTVMYSSSSSALPVPGAWWLPPLLISVFDTKAVVAVGGRGVVLFVLLSFLGVVEVGAVGEIGVVVLFASALSPGLSTTDSPPWFLALDFAVGCFVVFPKFIAFDIPKLRGLDTRVRGRGWNLLERCSKILFLTS